LRQDFDEKTVLVRALSDKHGQTTVAQQLYQETDESVEKRAMEKELRQLSTM